MSVLATIAALLSSASLASTAAADEYLIGLWGPARIGNFEETWKGDDPANLDLAFGASDSHVHDSSGYDCTKRWNSLGMKVDFWTFGTMDVDPCDEGLFGRAQLTSPLFHTSNDISPGDSAKSARRKAVARCSRSPFHWCGFKGYILSTHRSDCAGGHVPSVVARVRHNRVSSLIVNTTGCE